MEIKEAIQKRKSIRAYQQTPIPKKLTNELINAARLAPSGCNKQGARYKVISNKNTIQLLKDNEIYTQKFVYTAPVLILCCYDKTAYPEQKDKTYGTDHTIRAIRDLSIASSFLILRATELGLGTCYIGWLDKTKAKELLNIPENLEILFTITVGYPSEQGKPRIRKELNEILL